MLSEIFKQVNLKCSPWGLACAVTSTAGASFLGRYIFYIYPWIIWDCSVTKVVAESMLLTVSMSLYWFGLVPRWLTNRNLHPGEVRPKTGVSPLPGDVRAPCSEGSHRWLAHFAHPAALGSWQSPSDEQFLEIRAGRCVGLRQALMVLFQDCVEAAEDCSGDTDTCWAAVLLGWAGWCSMQ